MSEQSWAEIKRGTDEIIPEAEFRARFEKAAADGTPLIVKAGFDPTAPDLHLGHTVLLNKMRWLQDMGHDIVFLILKISGVADAGRFHSFYWIYIPRSVKYSITNKTTKDGCR